LVKATTRKKALIAEFLDIAGRIPGVDHMFADSVEGLAVQTSRK
jgi:hypothetical protein